MAQAIAVIGTETLDIKFSWSECILLGGGSCPRQCYDHQKKIHKSVLGYLGKDYYAEHYLLSSANGSKFLLNKKAYVV